MFSSSRSSTFIYDESFFYNYLPSELNSRGRRITATTHHRYIERHTSSSRSSRSTQLEEARDDAWHDAGVFLFKAFRRGVHPEEVEYHVDEAMNYYSRDTYGYLFLRAVDKQLHNLERDRRFSGMPSYEEMRRLDRIRHLQHVNEPGVRFADEEDLRQSATGSALGRDRDREYDRFAREDFQELEEEFRAKKKALEKELALKKELPLKKEMALKKELKEMKQRAEQAEANLATERSLNQNGYSPAPGEGSGRPSQFANFLDRGRPRSRAVVGRKKSSSRFSSRSPSPVRREPRGGQRNERCATTGPPSGQPRRPRSSFEYPGRSAYVARGETRIHWEERRGSGRYGGHDSDFDDELW